MQLCIFMFIWLLNLATNDPIIISSVTFKYAVQCNHWSKVTYYVLCWGSLKDVTKFTFPPLFDIRYTDNLVWNCCTWKRVTSEEKVDINNVQRTVCLINTQKVNRHSHGLQSSLWPMSICYGSKVMNMLCEVFRAYFLRTTYIR